MTLREAIAEASQRIDKRDAELLLAHIVERERTYTAAYPEESLTSTDYAAFRGLIARRAAREPLQYITGRQEFYGLNLCVTPDVLIPRPETEHLVEAVLLWATKFHDERTLYIADIGTGSGAIVVALATHLAGASFTATDISAGALNVARENARSHGCEDRIDFMHGDLLSGIGGDTRFDAIVSNPPYVPLTDAPTMQQEVVAHEPHIALFAGGDGLDLYRRLLPAAAPHLKEDGLLALEIGHGQRDAVAELLGEWRDVRFIDDYQGIPRIALATRRNY